MIDFKRESVAWPGVLFWWAFMLILDVMLGGGFVEAVRSEWFATAPGVVTKSEIVRNRKRNVHFEVEYTYTVNDQRYTGTKYHVGPQLVGNGFWLAAHDANPVGAQVTVYYDPDEPATAYLAPGPRPDSLLLLWMLTPFNLVTAGFAWAAWGYVTARRGFDPALRRCVRAVPNGWLVRPDPNTRFIVVAFTVLLAITFGGSFVAGMYVASFDNRVPWALPLSMWAGALLATVVFAAIKSRRALVHINELEETITVRHAGVRVTVARKNILGYVLTTEVRKHKSGPYEVHVVALRWRDQLDQEQSLRLAEFTEARDANALVNWLSDRLQLPTTAQIAV